MVAENLFSYSAGQINGILKFFSAKTQIEEEGWK